jgi:hypothetical protein
MAKGQDNSEDLTAIPIAKVISAKSALKKSAGKNNRKATLSEARKERLSVQRKREIYAEVKAEGQSSDKLFPVEGEVVRMGRPSKYSEQLATQFCTLIASGMSLKRACKQEGMPDPQTIFTWFGKHKEFLDLYTRATEERSESFHEDILDISDDGSNDWMEANYGGDTVWITNGEALQRSRLRVETRKWLMEKMKPRKYGAKLDLTSDGKELPTPLFGGMSVSLNTTTDVKPKQIDGEVSQNAGETQ